MDFGSRLDIENFFHQYAYGSDNTAVNAAALASVGADLLAMEAGVGTAAGAFATFFQPTDIDQIQQAGTLVTGYMSIGTIDTQRPRYESFQPFDLGLRAGTETFLEYWNPNILPHYQDWIADLVGPDGLGMDGVFLDVTDTYAIPGFNDALPGDTDFDEVVFGSAAMMDLIVALDTFGRSLNPDFVLYVNAPFLISNHYFPVAGENNSAPQLNSVNAVRAVVDAVLIESYPFGTDPAVPLPSGQQRDIDRLTSPTDILSFGEATRLAIGFDLSVDGGAPSTVRDALGYQLAAAENGYLPYITPGSFTTEGFDQAYPLFNVATDGADALVVGDGNDAVDGFGGADWIRGDGRANQIRAGSGDDFVDGLGGADTLNGGGGTDIARFVGNRSDYTIDGTTALATVTDGGVTAQLTSIEVLRFDDQDVGLPPPADPPEPGPTTALWVLVDGADRHIVADGAVEAVTDSPGSQVLTVETGASLTLSGVDGANTVILPGIAGAFAIQRDGGSVTLTGPAGERVVFSPSTDIQTLVFDDGAVDVQVQGAAILAGTQVLTETAATLSSPLDPVPTLPPVSIQAPLEPTAFGIAIDAAAVQRIAGGSFAQIVDADGGQTYHVDQAASLTLQAAAGANRITLQGNAESFLIVRDGGWVTLAGPSGEQVRFSARDEPQTLVFFNGAADLAIIGEDVVAGGQVIDGVAATLLATLDGTDTSAGLFAASTGVEADIWL